MSDHPELPEKVRKEINELHDDDNLCNGSPEKMWMLERIAILATECEREQLTALREAVAKATSGDLFIRIHDEAKAQLAAIRGKP